MEYLKKDKIIKGIKVNKNIYLISHKNIYEPIASVQSAIKCYNQRKTLITK